MAIEKVRYIQGYTLQVTFSNGISKTIDFTPFLAEIKVPEYKKYQQIEEFKTFELVNGNLVWGEDWDLIYPIEVLLST